MKITISSLFRFFILMLCGVGIQASDLDTKLAALKPQIEAIANLLAQKKCQPNCTGENPPASCTRPLLFQFFKDPSLTSDLYKALMAGLFIDDFSDPLEAAHTVGLAHKIYALRVDDKNKLRPINAPLPINCSAETSYALEKPYDNLKQWVIDEFNTARQLGKTTQEVLDEIMVNDGFLRSLSDDDYAQASQYWGARKLKQGSGKLPTIGEETTAHKAKNASAKIAAFKEKYRKPNDQQTTTPAKTTGLSWTLFKWWQ